MNERKFYLQALVVNEDDSAIRYAYADWLDEQGEYDEANRQRAWPASKNWLVKFFNEHSDGDYIGNMNSYQEMMAVAKAAVEKFYAERGGRIVLDCGANDGLVCGLRSNRHEFWKHFSIVTGIVLPLYIEGKAFYYCSC